MWGRVLLLVLRGHSSIIISAFIQFVAQVLLRPLTPPSPWRWDRSAHRHLSLRRAPLSNRSLPHQAFPVCYCWSVHCKGPAGRGL